MYLHRELCAEIVKYRSKRVGKGDGARGVDYQRRMGLDSAAGTESCCEQEEERLHI
jgi:hypothetical protein